MSLNPLNELKRRLEDETTPLPKRLCLARNIVHSHHFPSAPKEVIVATWLDGLAQTDRLTGKDLKDILGWVTVDDLTSELKSRLIQVVLQFLKTKQIEPENIQHILSFLENDKITNLITQEIDDYLTIIVTILQYLKTQEIFDHTLSNRILNNLIKYYKECKKKLEFVIKFIYGENLETIFSFLHTESHNTVIEVCRNVLFPINRKSFFVSFLQTLIRKDNLDELMAEKGDNIQSVVEIMNAFFEFPNGRIEKNQQFLSDFIEVFVSCFKKEHQLIFAFHIMAVNTLNMEQNYLNPAMKMPPIIFVENDDKIKRNLFLKMLKVILINEVDLNVRLTDTFGEKISKGETKKTFSAFLQAIIMGQLKLEGKVDKISLQIINLALKLDPVLIENKIDQILPPVMTSKKNHSTNESYTEMLNCLLEILFKLSRGTVFVNQILPQLKVCLEAGNTEQFELRQKINECEKVGENCDKLKSKLLSGKDVFPPECVEVFGKWTSELMFRQNKELLATLQKDLEESCLMMLEEQFVSPSTITIVEVLSAILSSFLQHNKMADHTVPKLIAEDFWTSFQKFESECLRKFGECVLKHNNNSQLAVSFLTIALSVAHLKLLNLKYSHTQLEIPVSSTSVVFDFSVILPCLDSEQWITLASKVVEDEAVMILNNLLLSKIVALELLSNNDSDKDQNSMISTYKIHLIKELNTNPDILNIRGCSYILFADLDATQLKSIAKCLVKLFMDNPETEILNSDAILNNRNILNAIVLETAKNIAKSFEQLDGLSKILTKTGFNLNLYLKELNVKEYFEEITIKDDQETTVSNCLNIYKQLPLPYLEESYQLVAIFLLLSAKKCCQKKLKKCVDHILLNIFELSPKYPDIFKIFSVDLIFSFDDRMIFNLLTLKVKHSNNMFVIKSILESAAKKVKSDSEIIKSIVQILLTQQKSKTDDISSIQYFSDPVFQIICIILPIIAKEKRAITTSTYRSILADLQEKLHQSLLKCIKDIDFGNNSSLLNETNGNIDESMVVSENTLATLNAMAAYSLTLGKYCETTDVEEIKNLECLWSGLGFFVENAIISIENPSTKTQHVDSSIQLLNVTLRYIKKLESHTIFQNKDQIFQRIWKSILERLKISFGHDNRVVLDDLTVALKYLCELTSVEGFVGNFVGDLASLGVLDITMKPKNLKDQSVITLHKVSKYLWLNMLKANLLGPKCVALSKLLSKLCKELRCWIQTYFEDVDMRKAGEESRVVRAGEEVCEVLRLDLDVISEAVLAAKKITLDYKLLDSIFSSQQQILYIISSRVEISWNGYLKLFEGCVSVLNNLLVSREELLEDRWPNYMQCYRGLLSSLCEKSSTAANPALERHVEDKLSEIAHSVEKLTQSMCKRKAHVSRIAAYSVADICALLERCGPRKQVRQHLENCAALLLQAADSSYSASFLRRALASAPGHVTLANMYNVYKRYHKYVGNA